MSCKCIVWLIPYLIAKSSTSVGLILVAWWTVLEMISWPLKIWEIEVIMLFLIFISVIISIVSFYMSDSLHMLSSLSQWVFSSSGSLQLTERREKWLEKVSTRQKLRESFLFKLLKEEKISSRQLLVSIIKLLIFVHCLAMSWNVAI